MAKKREPKPADAGKSSHIQIRISETEKSQFAKAAALDNRPLSGWIRDRLLKISRQELAGAS